MEKKMILLLAIGCAVVLFGCNLPTSETANKTSGDPGPTEQIPDDNGTGDYKITGTNPVVFETYAEKYLQPNGYTFWQRRGTLAIKNTPSGLTVKLAKTGGDSNGGYGVVFSEGNDRMLTVLLRLDGSYCIGEVIGVTWQMIVPWTSTTHLITGTGIKNTVNISWDTDSLDYIVSINGVAVRHFTDDIAPVTGTGFGYIVVLTGEEKFPETPVGISFEKVDPPAALRVVW